MVGRIGGGRRANDLARHQPARLIRGNEGVVEADVRVPHGKGQPSVVRVQTAEAVHVAGVDHDLDRAPPDSPAAQPHQGAQALRQLAEVEQLSGRQRVEVPRDQVSRGRADGSCEAGCPARARAAVRSRPRARRSGARRRCERRCRAARSRGRRAATAAAGAIHDLWSRVPAHEAQRRPGACATLRHAAVGGQPLDDLGTRRLLENHEIRLRRRNHLRERTLPSGAAMADVVGQEAEAHAGSDGSTGSGLWTSTR